jgi:hypothetical protein
MPATYEPIATTTLSSAQANITFSTIPATYTDLKIILVNTTTTSIIPALRFNSDTGSNYSNNFIVGNRATVGANDNINTNELFFADSTVTSTTIPVMYMIDIFSYAGSTFKSTLSTDSGDLSSSGRVEKSAGLWRSTAAITSIELRGRSSTWASGTTATLYGIKSA